MLGEISWHALGEYDEAQIERAILRDAGQTLVVDFVFDATRYSMKLTRGADNVFSGNFEVSKGREKWGVRVSGRLFTSGNRHVVLGSWSEGDNYKFVLELEDTDHFPDETSTIKPSSR